MNTEKPREIHFVGIGGIGMSALAKYSLSQDFVVSGSDERDSEIIDDLKQHGATVALGHNTQNVDPDLDRLIYSDAVPSDNLERRQASKQGIPSQSYAEALGEMMGHYYGIAISGTNGKTTTTAMLGKIFEAAELDPFVVVGGKVPGWDSNLRLPVQTNSMKEEQIFLAEACEYRRNMLHFLPKEILLTNIEEDHLDYYRDLDDILDAFQDFVGKLSPKSTLFFNADDENSVKIARHAPCKTVSYGKSDEADVQVKNIRTEMVKGVFTQRFDIFSRGIYQSEVSLPIPGEFNVMNALAAASVALTHGIPIDIIHNTLENFHGTWRRFEHVGTYKGIPVISDYAHHPTAVKQTIAGTKAFFPEGKVLTVFQPHQKDRTKKLFQDFKESFDEADGVIFSEIYEVEGREEEIDISSKDLADAVRARGMENIFYADDLKEAREILTKKIGNFDVVLIMGAGSVYTLADTLVGGNA